MSYSLAEAAQATGLNEGPSAASATPEPGRSSRSSSTGCFPPPRQRPRQRRRTRKPMPWSPSCVPSSPRCGHSVMRGSALPNGLPWARPSRQNPTQSRCPRPCLMHHRRRAGAAPGAGCARPADRHGEDAGATKGQSPIASRSPYAAGPRCSHIFGAHWAEVGLHVRNLAV